MNSPFIDELKVAESSVSEVYGSEYDRIYNVRSKVFCKDFVARAYTAKLDVNIDGSIDLDIVWKDGKKREVRRPFHFIANRTLFAMKIFKHNISDSFALNHELFALEWDTCVILHFFNEEPYIFVSSREEWMALCVPGQQNEELQVFLNVPDFRRMPASLIPEYGKSWLKQCVEYKRNRECQGQ